MRRLPELDALRGIAAFLVVISHALPGGWPGPDFKWLVDFTPFGMARDGRASVILFFVLSGFVLTSAWNADPRWLRFTRRRVLRVWLPFAAALAFAAALYAVTPLSPAPEMGEGFNGLWRPGLLSADSLSGHLLMLGRRADSLLDNPVWSLPHELRISVLLPLLIAACLRAPRATLFAAFVVSALVALRFDALPGWQVPWFGATVAEGLLATAYYGVFFALGVVLAQRPGWRPAGAWRAALWAACAVAFSMRVPSRLLTDLAYGGGATGLIALSTTSPIARRVLALRPLPWLGRVSYSLYLVHVPILLAAVHGMHGVLPLPVVLLGAVGAALGAAEVFHRLAEAPAIALSRRGA